MDKLYNTFNEEGLSVIDDNQIVELKRWFLSDFEELTEYKNDQYVTDTKIISICGCGRSGTTLTRVMLDTHPELFSGPESSLFLPIKINVADLSYKFDMPESEILVLIKEAKSRSEFIDRFQNLVLSGSNGKKIWIDKTARNIHCLQYIFSHFPEAKIINVVRDPRDTIASLRTHKKRKIENGIIKATGYLMPISLCIERWNKCVNDAIPYRHNRNYCEVKYEELICDTKKTLIKICDFCEVQFDNNMLRFHEFSGPTRDATRFIQNIEATSPVKNTSIDRYKTDLSESQIRRIVEKTRFNASIINYKI